MRHPGAGNHLANLFQSAPGREAGRCVFSTALLKPLM